MELRVDVASATLHVEVDGSCDNPALLLWPPGNSTVRVWDHLASRIKHRFCVVRIDVRGWGLSKPKNLDESQFAFEQYAKDAFDVLKYLDIAECHIWSQSWGSRAAMVFCATYPQKAISAAFYAANTDLPDVPAQREGTKRAAQLRQEAGIATIEGPKEFNSHSDPNAARLVAQAVRKFDLTTIVDKLTMPVLIGTGSHDPNLVSSRVIASTVPNAKLVVFENVGHNAILEHPSLALETFLSFQDRLSS